MRASAVKTWGPFLGALAVVFWLSSLPTVPGARYFWDKLLHVVGYAGLGVLALRAFHGGLMPLRPRLTILTGIVIVLWGVSDEYHQSFVPGRDSSALDVAADTLGFLVAVAIVAVWAKRRAV